MWSLITSIPGLVSGLFGSINHITDAISNEKIALINAKTDEERISSQERISALEQRRAVMIAEAGVSRINMFVRAFLGAPAGVILWKLMVWDKVIGSFVGCSGHTMPGTCQTFNTDVLDDNQWHVIMIVLGFYFLYEGAMGVTRLAKR